jgi:hypothetical protein
VTGSAGLTLMPLAVQLLTLLGVVAQVGGWMLLIWRIGAALWAVQELWATRAR